MRSDVQSLDASARRSEEMPGGNTARKLRPRWREQSSRHGATIGVSSQLGPKKNDTSRFKSQSLTAVEDQVRNTDHGRNRLPDGQKDTGMRSMNGGRRRD